MSLIVAGSRTLVAGIYDERIFGQARSKLFMVGESALDATRTLKNSPRVLLNLIREIYSITPNKPDACAAGDHPTKWGNGCSPQSHFTSSSEQHKPVKLLLIKVRASFISRPIIKLTKELFFYLTNLVVYGM